MEDDHIVSLSSKSEKVESERGASNKYLVSMVINRGYPRPTKANSN